MDAKLQLRVQRYGWDRSAPLYEQYWSTQLQPAQSKMLEVAALRPGERVLDVACGTGLVTFPAARAVGPEGVVVGTDISSEMILDAQQRAASSGIENASFERADAGALQRADASFDAVLCGLGLMYFPDPSAALAEMSRVLVPGGRACFAVWGARDRCGWAEIFPIVDSRVKTEVCPLFFQLGTGDTLASLMERAGFEQVRSERLRTLLHYGSGEDACGAAFAGGPVALAYSRFDDETRDTAHVEYLQSVDEYRTGPGYEIPGEFVVVSGARALV